MSKSVINLIEDLKECQSYIYYYWLIMYSIMFNEDTEDTIYKIVTFEGNKSVTKDKLVTDLSSKLLGFKIAQKRIKKEIEQYYEVKPYKIVQQYYNNCRNKDNLSQYLKYDDIPNYKWYKINSEMIRAFKNNLMALKNVNTGYITDIFGIKVFWASFGSPSGYKDGLPKYNDVGMVVYATEPIDSKKWALYLKNRFKQSLVEQHKLLLSSTALYGGKNISKDSISNRELLHTLKGNERNYKSKTYMGFELWKEEILSLIEEYKELDYIDDGNRVQSFLNRTYDQLRLKEYNNDGVLSLMVQRKLNWLENQQESLTEELLEYNGF